VMDLQIDAYKVRLCKGWKYLDHLSNHVFDLLPDSNLTNSRQWA
jgi:hypothetical protein